MLRDGEYIAWFRTARGSGAGRVFLQNGRISGCDTIISYDGTYTVDGDFFRADIATRRHAAGHESLIGVDEVELALTGVSKGEFASCSGSVVGFPDIKVEVTLMPAGPDDHLKTPFAYGAKDFHPERLPKSKTR